MINNNTVSSIEAISSSDSIANELTRKSLSTFELLIDILYQFIKKERNNPNKKILNKRSKIIIGIKSNPSLCVSNSIKNLNFDTNGNKYSVSAEL
jgi:hypothetical protein